jgi:hypothetical protein
MKNKQKEWHPATKPLKKSSIRNRQRRQEQRRDENWVSFISGGARWPLSRPLSRNVAVLKVEWPLIITVEAGKGAVCALNSHEGINCVGVIIFMKRKR